MQDIVKLFKIYYKILFAEKDTGLVLYSNENNYIRNVQ